MQQWLHFSSLPTSELAKMDETSLYNGYRNVLSDGDLRTANEMIASAKSVANGGPSLSVAGSTESQMKDAAIIAGILPSGTTAYNITALENYAAFRSYIQEKVSALEYAKGKKATDEDLSKILIDAKTDSVKHPGMFPWSSDKVESPSKLTTAEKADSFVYVNGERINTFAIPTKQRQLIMQSAARYGVPLTEQEIARRWVQNGKPQ
jgi:hypothetical protein